MNQIPSAVREVVVVTDEPADDLGVVIGKAVFIDGQELLLPSEATVEAKVSGVTGLTVTVTFFASTVRFTHERP